jgi:hypothetical protein
MKSWVNTVFYPQITQMNADFWTKVLGFNLRKSVKSVDDKVLVFPGSFISTT